jgi:hypothetical protein
MSAQSSALQPRPPIDALPGAQAHSRPKIPPSHRGVSLFHANAQAGKPRSGRPGDPPSDVEARDDVTAEEAAQRILILGDTRSLLRRAQIELVEGPLRIVLQSLAGRLVRVHPLEESP